MVDHQDAEFMRLGLEFSGLFGRRLQPIDCQNLFCEVSKYARVAHPEVAGLANRTRIKQNYRPSRRPISLPQFPERWRLCVETFRSAGGNKQAIPLLPLASTTDLPKAFRREHPSLL